MVPYYGYARQDRKAAPRVPISAKLVADIITTAGARRLLAMDLHAGQIQGFFSIPVDHLFAAPVLLKHLREFPREEVVMVSPDAGGVERTRAFAKRLGTGLAIIDKRREKANESQVMHIIGDIKDKIAIILDDMVDTAGTLCNAAQALSEKGAKQVHACATHPVLSGPAVDRIAASALESVMVTNTIPLTEKARKLKKIKVFTVAPILGEAISRIHDDDSVSSLFV